MDRLIYKESDGDLTCRSRDFDKVFPTLYAYEELELTPQEIEQQLTNFSSFLMEMTGSRMSKTNYTVQAMVSEANDYFESVCDECSDRQQLDELKKELEQVRAERDYLLKKLRNNEECDACKNKDLHYSAYPCCECVSGPHVLEPQEERDHWEWEGKEED